MPFSDKGIGRCDCCEEDRTIASRGLCQRCYKAVLREEQRYAHALAIAQSTTFATPPAGPPDPLIERLVARHSSPTCYVRWTSWTCAVHARPILVCLNQGIEIATRRDRALHARLLKQEHRAVQHNDWDLRSTAPIRRGMRVATHASIGEAHE